MGDDRRGHGHGHVLVYFDGVRLRHVVRHRFAYRVRHGVRHADGHGARHVDGIRAVDRHGYRVRYAYRDGSGYGHGHGVRHGHGHVTGDGHGVRLRYRHGHDLLRLGHSDRYAVMTGLMTVTVRVTGVRGRQSGVVGETAGRAAFGGLGRTEADQGQTDDASLEKHIF